jgi:hypothetical protein
MGWKLLTLKVLALRPPKKFVSGRMKLITLLLHASAGGPK